MIDGRSNDSVTVEMLVKSQVFKEGDNKVLSSVSA